MSKHVLEEMEDPDSARVMTFTVGRIEGVDPLRAWAIFSDLRQLGEKPTGTTRRVHAEGYTTQRQAQKARDAIVGESF